MGRKYKKDYISLAKKHGVKITSDMTIKNITEKLIEKDIIEFEDGTSFLPKQKIYIPEYLSGPSTFYHVTLRGKDIIFLGDLHGSNEGICESCENPECLQVESWIQYLSDQLETGYIDLYVESGLAHIDHKKSEISFYTERDSKNHTKYPLRKVIELDQMNLGNLRYHHIDYREITITDNISGNLFNFVRHLAPNMTKLSREYLEKINSRLKRGEFESYFEKLYILHQKFTYFLKVAYSILKEYGVICALSQKFKIELESFIIGTKSSIENIKDETILKDLEDLLYHLDQTKNNTKKYKRMVLHPIGKQFRKYIEQEGYQVYDTEPIYKMVSSIYEKYEQQYKLRIEEIENRSISRYRFFRKKIKEKSSISNELLHKLVYASTIIIQKKVVPSIFLMDLYAIPRIMYSYPDSQAKIIYTGLSHVETYIFFMNQFHQDEVKLIQSVEWKKGRRCLHLRE